MKCIKALLVFFFIGYQVHVTHAQSVSVCAGCAVNSIKKAIELSNPFDTIYVEKGVYHESEISIEKPLTLIGRGMPVIDGEEKGEIIGIKSDSVSIIGFDIRNVGVSKTKDFSAIHVRESNYFYIKDNILSGVFFGLLVEKSKDGIIEGNIISGNAIIEYNAGNGIHLWNCKRIEVLKNELFGLRDGIYLEFVTESKITNNYSRDNLRYGLHFMFSDKDEYSHNRFINNGAGVAVMFSKFISMHHNHFFKNWGPASYGLLLKEIYDGEIEDNVFEENTTAIQTDGSTRINYRRNDFIRNGWAVKVTGGCYTNIFIQNNFVANSFDISYNSKMNDNLFDGNYWSSYTGYDLDKDGVGDIPFRPVNLFSYVVSKSPEAMVLLRSLFVDIINFSEKVSPIFTPDNLLDNNPLMREVK
ncbi:MAG: nitrous oxide reductase family maturation protein NosD [Cyclobacteriaceae bacterium]|nr:nitrous oxide reductase family maturation protein NosD [Cyclobacteriaceae bacterium]